MLYPISKPIPDSVDDMVGYIDNRGDVIIPPSYSACSHFFEGVAAVRNSDGKTGFIDSLGATVIPHRFNVLGRFHEGLCSIDGGYIDHHCNWVIEPQFLVASEFSEGLAFASIDAEMFGFINLTGAFVVSAEFERCRTFHEGLAAVLVDDRWGYIDRKGTFKIPAVFEGKYARGFSEGLAGVRIDGRGGFIDHEGRFVIKPVYEDVRPFVEGLACVAKNGKWGFIDTRGRQVVECTFDKLGRLHRGMAPAERDGKAGFISKIGQWSIEPTFNRCYEFFGDLAVIRQENTYSYISRDGTIIWTSDPHAQVQRPPAPVFV